METKQLYKTPKEQQKINRLLFFLQKKGSFTLDEFAMMWGIESYKRDELFREISFLKDMEIIRVNKSVLPYKFEAGVEAQLMLTAQ